MEKLHSMEKEMERKLCSFVQNHDLDSFIQHYQPHVDRYFGSYNCQGHYPDEYSAYLCDSHSCVAGTANKCITFVLTLIRLCIFFRNTKAFEAILSSEYSMGIYDRQKMDTDIRAATVECVSDIFFGVCEGAVLLFEPYFRDAAIQTLIEGPFETYIETILFVFNQDNFKYAISFLESMTMTAATMKNERVEVIHRFFLQHDLLAVPDIRCHYLRYVLCKL
jgi:hypothetical protein